jgi:hypothetical protein
MFCIAAAGSREGRDALLPGAAGEGVCDSAGIAAMNITVQSKMDNEGLFSDICPLFVRGIKPNERKPLDAQPEAP